MSNKPHGERHHCYHCGKLLPEIWHWEYTVKEQEVTDTYLSNKGDNGWERVQVKRMKKLTSFEDNKKFYTNTYGYNGGNLFCTLRCGYKYAVARIG